MITLKNKLSTCIVVCVCVCVCVYVCMYICMKLCEHGLKYGRLYIPGFLHGLPYNGKVGKEQLGKKFHFYGFMRSFIYICRHTHMNKEIKSFKNYENLIKTAIQVWLYSEIILKVYRMSRVSITFYIEI